MVNQISRLILKKICNDEDFARKTLPYIKKEYFEGQEKVAYSIILRFISKYNALPSKSSLIIEFANSEDNVEANQNTLDILQDVVVDEDVTSEWLYEKTEEWCKDRAILLGIMKSIEIIDGKEKVLGEGAIPDILQKALSVSFDKSVGHDYDEDYEARFNFYHADEEKIPFDIELLNNITNGGIVNKSLNVIMGATGGGKSLALCHFAASYISRGLNVLYVTMEMSEERIAERIDANLLDTNIQDIEGLTKTEFTSKIENIKKNTLGKLIIKEYPTSRAHAGHIRNLLSELKLKKNIKPDVIIIDYLNIMASERMRMGGTINSYSFVKAVAEELRGLAVEYDVPIWSATQVNRAGINNSDVDLTNTSESMGLPSTCDLFLSMIVTEQLDALNQIMFKQLKNRYNDLNNHRRFVTGIDRPKMRLYDVDDSAQDDIMPEVTEYAIGASSDAAATFDTDGWDIE